MRPAPEGVQPKTAMADPIWTICQGPHQLHKNSYATSILKPPNIVRPSKSTTKRTMDIRTSSSARVLGIPELVCLISSYSDRSDIIQMSQACRLMFDALIPLIWQHVNGADNLLRLIRSTVVKGEKSTGKYFDTVYNCDTE